MPQKLMDIPKGWQDLRVQEARAQTR